MRESKILFWNVDTQVDFMDPDGKLYVPGAEKIKPVLAWITKLANKKKIQVVNTSDYHYLESGELSENPDFINTFPRHCMAGSRGADYIAETLPTHPYSEILWNKHYSLEELRKMAKMQNIIIRKDAFDVFTGNPNTESLINILTPEKVFVYGVTTNVCVDRAVMGLAKRKIKVYVIEDAIKELPNIPLPYKEWNKQKVKLIQSKTLNSFL